MLRDSNQSFCALPQGKACFFSRGKMIMGVAHFIDACIERVSTLAGPPWGTRHLIGLKLAGIDVIISFPSLSGPYMFIS